MSKNNERYINHIIEGWRFATKTVEEELKLKNHVKTNVTLIIFEKVCSPLHYFLQDTTTQEPKPTEKQIKYAKKLNIEKPESYTKKTLSDKIREVVGDV